MLRLTQTRSRATTAWPFDNLVQPTTVWIAEDIALYSAHLEDFFHRDRVRLPYDPFGPIVAPQEALHRLVDWTGDASARRLWIDSAPTEGDDIDDTMTMLSAKVLTMAS